MSISGIFPIDKWNFLTQSILNVLSPEDYNFLILKQGKQKYKKGEIIFKEGIVPSGVFYIHTGKVKKYKVDKTGREQIIYIASKGELIGYHAVLSEERYPDSTATLDTCILSFIPKEDFLDLLDRSQVFARGLLKALSHEFTVLTNSILVFSQRTAVERLAIALVVLHEKYKIETPEGQEIIIDISRTDLANIAGIAKENVIRFLREFKSEGFIDSHGRKIWVKDVKKLIARSNYK